MKKITVIFILIITTTLLLNIAYGQDIVFPNDAGIINVKDYGAKGDGTTDDTQAIQTALDAYSNGSIIIYLPNGTYLVSNTLKWPPSTSTTACSNCWKRTTMMGQSRDGAIIKLKNSCSGFQDANNPKGVIWTGTAPAQRFRNGVRNLTVNVGTNNPGSAGIQLNTSNQGFSERLKIISEDGKGVSGLDLAFTGEIGPGYVNDLLVDGFQYGVRSNAYNSMTLENVTVQHQTVYGIYNANRTLTIRNLTSHNSVTAVKNGGGGNLSIINGTLDGGSSSNVAISTSGVLYARNITTSGYSKSIDNTVGNGNDGNDVTEFCSYNTSSLFSSPQTMLNLPATDMPSITWDALSNWVSPLSYGAKGDGTTDDTQAFQSAIDVGKTTVYIPGSKTFVINGNLYIRGAVRTIIGCSGKILGSGKIIFQNGTAPVVVIHDINALYSTITFSFEATRTLRLSCVSGLVINSSNTGDFYLTDLACNQFNFNNAGQKIWARQLNPEDGVANSNIINNGATLWLLGLKTERGFTKLLTKNGGKSEVIGIHNYSTSSTGKDEPYFVCDNSSLSFACYMETNNGGIPYQYNTREIRGTTTKNLSGLAIPMFVGYEGVSASPTLASINVSVIPNPTHGQLTVQLPDEALGANLSVYNYLGIEVYNVKLINSGISNIDISNQPAGIYIIKIKNNNNSFVKQIILTK